MARTEIAVAGMPNIRDGLGVGESLKTYTALTGQAGANGNSCKFAGREIIEVRNTGAGAHNFTITSVADNLGRTGDITESIAAGAVHHYQLPIEGFRQSDGMLYFEGADAELEVCITRPRSSP